MLNVVISLASPTTTMERINGHGYISLSLKILRSNPSRQHSLLSCYLGCQEKRKDKKTRKVEVMRKWVPIPRKETGGSHPGWNEGDRLPDAEENPGSRYRQRLVGQGRLMVYSTYIRVKQE